MVRQRCQRFRGGDVVSDAPFRPSPPEFRAENVITLRDGRWGYRTIAGIFINERDIPWGIRPWRRFIQTTPINSTTGEVDEDVAKGIEKFYANSHYLVFVREMQPTDEDNPDVAKHLSIRTVENDVRHDWRDFQRIKNELCGEHWEACEIYPDVDRLVDTANQYHLWCFPFRLPFGFTTRFVMDHGAVETSGGKQRPMRPGLEL